MPAGGGQHVIHTWLLSALGPGRRYVEPACRLARSSQEVDIEVREVELDPWDVRVPVA